MLEAVFYARFHPERGPSVIHQYPEASILSATPKDSKLLDFSDISSWVIPAYELCNRSLAVCTNGHRILGFPVSLENESYERTRFTYNVCFVLSEDADPRQWDSVVSKTAAFFTDIEQADGLLQAEEQLDGLKWAGEESYPAEDVGFVYTLLETIFCELNAYGEACVQVTDSQVLNLRLAVPVPATSHVRAWDVPLLIRGLPNADEWTSDLALQRIQAYVNGINHIHRIAELADMEIKLVVKTVQELLRHKRVMLLDIFHFKAIYTLTIDFAWFAKDEAMQQECSRYVAKPTSIAIEHQTLVTLYRNLGPGISVRDFYSSHKTQLEHIDIRRFITFGVIKGFVRRIHKYALAVDSQSIPARNSLSDGSPTKAQPGLDSDAERDRAWRKAAFSSGWATPPPEPGANGQDLEAVQRRTPPLVEVEDESRDVSLVRKYLDGRHCMDEICVALHLSEQQVLNQLRGSDVLFFDK